MKILSASLVTLSVILAVVAASSYARMEAQAAPQVQFDLYQVPMPVPSEPRFLSTIMLDLAKSEEYLGAGHPEQPSLFLFIPCGDHIVANPCGPEGRAPDRFGGIAETVEAP